MQAHQIAYKNRQHFFKLGAPVLRGIVSRFQSGYGIADESSVGKLQHYHAFCETNALPVPTAAAPDLAA